jgi:hypothetical protein
VNSYVIALKYKQVIFVRTLFHNTLTRKNGVSALILQAQSTCKISALNEDCTTGMLPMENAV